MTNGCVREILPNVKDFKQFWKEKGPFRYALTSAGFPPVLLQEEEWIFGNDLTGVLKALMGFEEAKMAFVRAPFNPGNRSILRPEDLSQWKINHFPELWNNVETDLFTPEGHLTLAVVREMLRLGLVDGAESVEKVFFPLLARQMEVMGYVLLEPVGNAKSASIASYLEEWEEDDMDAGLL